MNRLPHRLLLTFALLALPLSGFAGTTRPACGAVQTTAATPLMSRHAALKLQAEAQLLGRDQSSCSALDNEPDTDEDTAGSHAGESEDRHARHPGAARMCPVAAALTQRELSQYRHMPPRSPLGTLAGASPDSLFLPSPAHC